MPVKISYVGKAEESIPREEPEKFKCMLAASEIPSYEELRFPLIASFKLDGIRSPMTSGIAMSRKMLPLPNRSIQRWASDNADYLHGLDGELIIGPPNLQTTFNTTTSGVMKEAGTPDFKFYVFDHWSLGVSMAYERHTFLGAYVKGLPDKVLNKIVLLEQRQVNNVSELKDYYTLALKLGYEGLILKHPRRRYKFGRSTVKEGFSLKFKEFIDYECRIDEVKQGQTNMNEKVMDELGHAKRSTAKAGKELTQQVGGFVVTCVDTKSVYCGMKFNCGPGSLTKNDLKSLWTVKDKLVGTLIRVKSQKLGGKSLPRYPSFYGWVFPMNIGDEDE